MSSERSDGDYQSVAEHIDAVDAAPDAHVIINAADKIVADEGSTDELRELADALEERARGYDRLQHAVDALAIPGVEVANWQRSGGDETVAMDVRLRVELPLDEPSVDVATDSADAFVASAATPDPRDDGNEGGPDVVHVDAEGQDPPLPPRHNGPITADEAIAAIRDAVEDIKPWDHSGDETPAVPEVEDDQEGTDEDETAEEDDVQDEQLLPTLDIEYELDGAWTKADLLERLQETLDVAAEERRGAYLTNAELTALRDLHPAAAGDEEPVDDAVADGFGVERARNPSKTDLEQLLTAAIELVDEPSDDEDGDGAGDDEDRGGEVGETVPEDGEVEEPDTDDADGDEAEPDAGGEDANGTSTQGYESKEELLADIRQQLALPDEGSDATKQDLREIYVALDLGSQPDAVLMSKSELADTIRSELDISGVGPTIRRDDLDAIRDAVSDAVSEPSEDGNLPGGIERSALKAAAKSHDTLAEVADAVDASKGAARSALFAVDMYQEVREGGSRSGAGPGGGRA